MDVSSWIAALRQAFQVLVERIGARLPDLAGALVLLLAGWLLARAARAIMRRVLTGLLERIHSRHPWLERVRRLHRWLPATLGAGAYWAVLLLFGLAAADTLGLASVGSVIASVVRYVPQVVAGVLVAFVGVAAAALAQEAVANAAEAAGLPYARGLGRAVQVAILLLAFVTAARQAGPATPFLLIALPVARAAVLGGAALAFGLGARTAVTNIIGAYHFSQIFEVGQRVRVAGFEGRIAEVTPTAVILDTAEGRVVAPAKLFSEQVSVLLAPGEE
jgi:small-conductance mechanosensitive channel